MSREASRCMDVFQGGLILVNGYTEDSVKLHMGGRKSMVLFGEEWRKMLS